MRRWKRMSWAPPRPRTNVAFVCSVCAYVRPVPEADPAELDALTVVGGMMVCVRHIPCVGASHHESLLTAVRLESGDSISSLTQYQVWRDQLEKDLHRIWRDQPEKDNGKSI